MLEVFLSLLTVSFCIERIVEYVFSINFLKKIKERIKTFPVKILSSLIISLCVAYFSNLDFINLLISSAEKSTFGIVLTGILISGGSNVINDIISKIKEMKNIKTET